MSDPPRSAKQVTRRRLREARAAGAAGPEAEPQGVADALAAHAGAALAAAGTAPAAGPPGPGVLVAVHRSLPREPGTGALRARLRADGHGVLLPVLLPDLDLDWVLDPGPPDDGDPLRPDGPRLGHDALAACVLVLVPALAVDRRGTRLGQGGGSYDRALSRLAGPRPPRPLVLAVVHDDEVLDDPLPREPHDQGVDGALTPSGVVLLG